MKFNQELAKTHQLLRKQIIVKQITYWLRSYVM